MERKSTVDGSSTVMANLNLSMYHSVVGFRGEGVFQSIKIITFTNKAEGGDSADIHLSIIFCWMVSMTFVFNRYRTCLDMNQPFKSLYRLLAY